MSEVGVHEQQVELLVDVRRYADYIFCWYKGWLVSLKTGVERNERDIDIALEDLAKYRQAHDQAQKLLSLMMLEYPLTDAEKLSIYPGFGWMHPRSEAVALESK